MLVELCQALYHRIWRSDCQENQGDEVKIIGTGDIERRKNQSRTTSITVIVINIIAIVGIVPVGIIATVARF